MGSAGAVPPWPLLAPTHGGVELRQFRRDDADTARELSQDPYVPMIGTLPPRATAEQAELWVERQRARHAEGAGFSFAVVDTAQGRCVGFVGLRLRESGAGRATVGYAIAPSFRGRGLAADAVRAVTGFAWSLPAIHRIELFIEPWNTASIRTAERAGYVCEGLLRSYLEIGGERRDMLLYASVRERTTPAPPDSARASATATGT